MKALICSFPVVLLEWADTRTYLQHISLVAALLLSSVIPGLYQCHSEENLGQNFWQGRSCILQEKSGHISRMRLNLCVLSCSTPYRVGNGAN